MKKLLSLIVVFCLTSTFIGCGEKTETKTETTTTTPEGETTTTETTTVEKSGENPPPAEPAKP
jgi:hypothetical protein